MPTRYGEEQQSRAWGYPTDVAGFLEALGTSADAGQDARMRLEAFMMTPVARRMPPELHVALVRAGLLENAPSRSARRR